MRRFSTLLLFFFTTCATMAGTYYYVPHIHTGNDAWETYLILDNNAGEDAANFIIRLYDEEGLLETLEYDLLPLETRRVSLRSYGGITARVWGDSVLTRVRIGYVAKESTGGGTAEFDAPVELLKNPTLSLSDYTDVLTWSGFALWNYSYTETVVTPRIVLRNGTEVTGTAFTMQPYEKKVNYFDAEFGYPFADIASVTFFADDPVLTGILISGMENERLLFTAAKPYFSSWLTVTITDGGPTDYYGGQALVNDDTLIAPLNSYWSTLDYRHCTLYKINARTGERMDSAGISGHPRIHKVLQGGDRVFLLGENENRYFVAELNTNYLTFEWTLFLDEIPTSGEVENNPILRKITGAVLPGTGSLMMVCLTDLNYDLKRYLIRSFSGSSSASILESKTTTTDHLLGDVFYYNEKFYYFRTDRSGDSSTAYSKVNLYYNPYDSLTGGGKVYTLPSTDPASQGYHDGTSRSVVQSGAYVLDGTLYTTFQYCTLYRGTESAYAGPFRGPMPGVIVLATMDLADTSTFTHLMNTFIPCQFGAITSIAQEPGEGVAAFVADWRAPNFNTKVIPYIWPYGSSSYRMPERTATIPGVIIDPIFMDEDILFSSFSHFFYGGNNTGMSGDRTSLIRQHCRKPYGLFLQFGADQYGNW
jgi:hypothetical protein